jgi:hypothetical protein
MTEQETEQRTDDGVALILALVLLAVGGLVFIALGRSAASNIADSSSLKTQSSVEYAASGATNLAVQSARYSGNQFSQGVRQACLPNGSTVTLNGIIIEVDCSQYQYNQGQANTRVINFYACEPGARVSPACDSSNALVYANVTFDDFSLSGQNFCTFNGVTSTCGSAEQVNSWIVETGNN